MPERERKHLRGPVWRESVTDEVSAELSFHVEMRARELAARGLDLEEARRAALAQFGDISDVRAECETIASQRDRDMRRATYRSEFLQDTRYAVRQIRGAPWFSLLVIGTLGLGIASATTIFSAVHAVVLRPHGFANADRVHFISETWKESAGDVSPGTFIDLDEQATQFETIAAIDWSTFVLAAEGVPDQVVGAAVTPDYFQVFGVHPVLGRGFTTEDAQPGAPRVVILSHAIFREQFGGDRSVLGTDIRVDGDPARVVGVLPAGFDPLLMGEALWVPLALTPEQIAARGSHWLDVVGLARAGVPHATVQSELDRLAGLMREQHPADHEDRGIVAQPIREVLLGDYDRRLFLLLGAVSVVLLIACANVANLLLARGAAREKEIAVRAALGAGHGRILRQLLTENLVLSLATVALSIGIALVGARMIVTFAPADIPRIAETRIDPVVLAFAVIVGALSSLVFGLAPALRAVHTDLQGTLRSGGRDTQGGTRDWLRNSLVIGEVALSVLLLVGAGLLIRTSVEAARVDPGFRMDGIVSARVTLPEQTYRDPERVQAAFQRIAEAAATRPGVTHAAATSLPPLGAGGNEMFLNVEGRPATLDAAVVGRMRIVSNGYLEALGIPLLRGRGFDSRDVRAADRVTIISADLARRLWPGQDPLGRRFACCEENATSPAWKTVIGVAAAVRSQSPTIEPYPEFYLPLAQAPDGSWNWIQRSMSIVATGAQTDALVAAIRDAVHSVDGSVPVYGIGTVRDALRNATAAARFNMLLLSILGALGLVLAATGIYGVVSYFVNLRRKEIGVRMALGASTRSVLALTTRQAMGPVVIGLVLGALAALAATRLLAASLFGVTPTDPLTFGIALAGLLLVALGAILLPARRASRVDPIEALQA